MFLWVVCEIAIAACDLAEVVGSAIGLQLLFGIPLVWGCVITCGRCAGRPLPAEQGLPLYGSIVVVLIVTIGGCFASELFFSKPTSRRAGRALFRAPKF